MDAVGAFFARLGLSVKLEDVYEGAGGDEVIYCLAPWWAGTIGRAGLIFWPITADRRFA